MRGPIPALTVGYRLDLGRKAGVQLPKLFRVLEGAILLQCLAPFDVDRARDMSRTYGPPERALILSFVPRIDYLGPVLLVPYLCAQCVQCGDQRTIRSRYEVGWRGIR